jgi:hypothetical protein
VRKEAEAAEVVREEKRKGEEWELAATLAEVIPCVSVCMYVCVCVCVSEGGEVEGRRVGTRSYTRECRVIYIHKRGRTKESEREEKRKGEEWELAATLAEVKRGREERGDSCETHTHTHIRTHTYTYICTHIHTYTHTGDSQSIAARGGDAETQGASHESEKGQQKYAQMLTQ